MKKIFSIFIVIFIVAACSKDDNNNNNQNNQQIEVIATNKFGFFDLQNKQIFEVNFQIENTTELYMIEDASLPYTSKRITVSKIQNPTQDQNIQFNYFDGQNQNQISGKIEKIGTNFLQILSEKNRLIIPSK